MNPTILICVTSGIAAFKTLNLIALLRKEGYNVIVIMTEHAKKMISPKEFEKASGNKVISELFPKGFDYRKVLKERKVKHISLADRASVVCVVPATANVIAKLANGIADDILTTTVLASKAALLICPSMNLNMWNNKITQENMKKLRDKGSYFAGPEKGMLACGYKGKGRLADIKIIQHEIIKLAEKSNELKGKRILVTAGGTEEEIDKARVITNKSSGKMGIRIAEECAMRSAKVTLIRARTDAEPNVKLKEIRARNANDMLNAVRKNIRNNDVMIHAAAVSDFFVRGKKKGKMKSMKKINLELSPGIKIFEKVRDMNSSIFLVGFKAEYGSRHLKKEAISAMKKANADMMIANDISRDVFGSDENEVIIIDKKENLSTIKRTDKKIIAEQIADEIKRRLDEKS
ncbi:bifunctional phosphopantothenoylcysteine decarboxylase/phosphopantothenate--cysteine ligase CoaBC [Candidatus Woesearchaeota archaeon]|nr:bifunctional phosphopantothenoylcysteine decarboxylase/phosphopantothenate--cysteine ligase CoaBC [Candidatus Woesearchaeota archaeon]